MSSVIIIAKRVIFRKLRKVENNKIICVAKVFFIKISLLVLMSQKSYDLTVDITIDPDIPSKRRSRSGK